jgi:hypothetical protein
VYNKDIKNKGVIPMDRLTVSIKNTLNPKGKHRKITDFEWA